jgi:hypothetical protein
MEGNKVQDQAGGGTRLGLPKWYKAGRRRSAEGTSLPGGKAHWVGRGLDI